MLWFILGLLACTDKENRDDDGDGFTPAQGDCDDNQILAYPGGTEKCDGIDNDCNGEVDGDNAIDAQAWYLDRDEDGHPSEIAPVYACTQPDVTETITYIYFDDCDDTDETVYPGAPEVCDGKDNDCDEVIPSDEIDNDGDEHIECSPVESLTELLGEDCDDGDNDIHPAATEECDGRDNNCDGTVDEEGTYYADSDGDGYGSPDFTERGECGTEPSGFVDNDLDCDDSENMTYPDAIEVGGDGIDQNCDGTDNDGVEILQVGDLIVTEIMYNPASVPDVDGEWFEIYNNTSWTINLHGLQISQIDESQSFVIDSDVYISSGEHLVIGNSSDPTKNGLGLMPGYVIDGFRLANNGDSIIISYDGLVFDLVEYDGLIFPSPNGASLSLDPSKYSFEENDDGLNWCEGVSVFGLGDRGTPNSVNENCVQ